LAVWSEFFGELIGLFFCFLGWLDLEKGFIEIIFCGAFLIKIKIIDLWFMK
jgi:hypothetical protein